MPKIDELITPYLTTAATSYKGRPGDDLLAPSLRALTTCRSDGAPTSASASPPAARSIARLKAIKRRAAGRSEGAARRTILKIKRPTKSGTKKPRRNHRSNEVKDEKIFRLIKDLLGRRQPVRISAKGGSVTEIRKSLEEAKATGHSIIPEIYIPAWDQSTEWSKLIAWGPAAWELGGKPFTLHLSRDLIEKGLRSKKGLTRYIQERISRQLKRRFSDTAPAFWFIMEKGVLNEEAHIHGAIVIPPHGERLITEALLAAGGDWGTSERQLKISERRDPVRWSAYCGKWVYGTMSRLQRDAANLDVIPGVFAANRPMRAAAKEWYQSARKEGRTIYAT